jgi:hypothetical protein
MRFLCGVESESIWSAMVIVRPSRDDKANRRSVLGEA